MTGVLDPECGDLPVACVVPKHSAQPTAQEIKDWVKGNAHKNFGPLVHFFTEGSFSLT